MSESSDRNLLFGVLAVQLEYITAAQLMDAANKWMLDKKVPLSNLLVTSGVLTSDDCQFLELIVSKHIARSGSAEESLRRVQDPHSGSEVSKVTEFVSQIINPSGSEEQLNLTLSWTPDPNSSTQRFNVLRELARGGLGEVFVARDSELDREVALKKILDDKSVTADVEQRFIAEAKITGGLEHPGVVPVYGLGTFPDGRPFYAMRLIRGRSLRESIDQLYTTPPAERGSIEFDRQFRSLVRAVIEACYAIGYAHSRGVLHRDIKPQNIMLGKYGETLVVDWGLAKVTSQPSSAEDLSMSEPPMEDQRSSASGPTVMGTVLGTPGFMSPEQAHGRIELLDRRSDTFSLGATLYAVATGQVPYQGERRVDIIRAAQNCDYKKPRDWNPRLSKALEAICLKAMSEDPKLRYQTALDLAEDLDAWTAGAPVTALPETLLMKSARFARKHQAAMASAIVVMFLAIGGLLWANRAIGRERDLARLERDRAVAAEKIADDANQQARTESDKALIERDKADASRLAAESARRLAEQAANNAEEQQRKAESASTVANDNRNASLDILNIFVKELADDQVAFEPGLATKRLAILNTALGRFRSLLAKSPDDDRLQIAAIQLSSRIANIYRLTGKSAEFSEQITQATQAVEELLKKNSENEAILGVCGDVYSILIDQLIKSQGEAATLGHSLRAVELSKKRLSMRDQPLTRLGAGIAMLNHSELCWKTGQYADAKSFANQSHDMLRDLPLKGAQREISELMRCSALTSLSDASREVGEAEESVLKAESAIQITLGLTADSVNVKCYRAIAQMSQALGLAQLGRYDNARDVAAIAQTTFAELRSLKPDIVNYAIREAQSQLVLGYIASKVGDTKAAAESGARAQAIYDAVEPKTLNSIESKFAMLYCHALRGKLSNDEGKEFDELKKLHAYNPYARQLIELLSRD